MMTNDDIYGIPNLGCLLGMAYQAEVGRLATALDAAGIGITASEYLILRILYKNGDTQQCDISRILGKDKASVNRSILNLSAGSPYPVTVPHYEELYDGEVIRLKENSSFCLKVIHTPGHTPGSVTYYSAGENAAFVGDLLYEHSPGLTHFPGGNRQVLEQSIINNILTLPGDTILLSGHSSPITVNQEKQLLL